MVLRSRAVTSDRSRMGGSKRADRISETGIRKEIFFHTMARTDMKGLRVRGCAWGESQSLMDGGEIWPWKITKNEPFVPQGLVTDCR
jgi:hypothetical protein